MKLIFASKCLSSDVVDVSDVRHCWLNDETIGASFHNEDRSELCLEYNSEDDAKSDFKVLTALLMENE